jgi:hypothetical protein
MPVWYVNWGTVAQFHIVPTRYWPIIQLFISSVHSKQMNIIIRVCKVTGIPLKWLLSTFRKCLVTVVWPHITERKLPDCSLGLRIIEPYKNSLSHFDSSWLALKSHFPFKSKGIITQIAWIYGSSEYNSIHDISIIMHESNLFKQGACRPSLLHPARAIIRSCVFKTRRSTRSSPQMSLISLSL